MSDEEIRTYMKRMASVMKVPDELIRDDDDYEAMREAAARRIDHE